MSKNEGVELTAATACSCFFQIWPIFRWIFTAEEATKWQQLLLNAKVLKNLYISDTQLYESLCMLLPVIETLV